MRVKKWFEEPFNYISILITKVLGVLFIIPFTSLIGGQENMAPFTYAYAPYNIAIAVATAGCH